MTAAHVHLAGTRSNPKPWLSYVGLGTKLLNSGESLESSHRADLEAVLARRVGQKGF